MKQSVDESTCAYSLQTKRLRESAQRSASSRGTSGEAYRHPATEDARRPVDQISLAELCDVAISHREIFLEPDPPLALARKLGISQLRSNARDRLQEAISRAKDFFGDSDRV